MNSFMAQFSYKARRKTGEVVQGVLDVADRSAALMQIERLGLFPVEHIICADVKHRYAQAFASQRDIAGAIRVDPESEFRPRLTFINGRKSSGMDHALRLSLIESPGD